VISLFRFSLLDFEHDDKEPSHPGSLFSHDANSLLWMGDKVDSEENVGHFFDLLSISKDPQVSKASNLGIQGSQPCVNSDNKLIDSLTWRSEMNGSAKNRLERPKETENLTLTHSIYPSEMNEYFSPFSPSKPPILANSQDLSHLLPRSLSPRTKKCMSIADEYSKSIAPKTPAKSHTRDRARAKFEESTDGYIYLVRFKRAHRAFILSPTSTRDIQPGMFVKVEADRGEDLGIVLAKLPAQDYEEEIPTAGYRGRGFSSGIGERKFIIRLATPHEKLLIAEKVEEEEKVLAVILLFDCIVIDLD
jgi:hypothetical protein